MPSENGNGSKLSVKNIWTIAGIMTLLSVGAGVGANLFRIERVENDLRAEVVNTIDIHKQMEFRWQEEIRHARELTATQHADIIRRLERIEKAVQ